MSRVRGLNLESLWLVCFSVMVSNKPFHAFRVPVNGIILVDNSLDHLVVLLEFGDVIHLFKEGDCVTVPVKGVEGLDLLCPNSIQLLIVHLLSPSVLEHPWGVPLLEGLLILYYDPR